MYASIAIVVLGVATLLWGPAFLAMSLGRKFAIGLGAFAIVFVIAWLEYRSKTGGR